MDLRYMFSRFGRPRSKADTLREHNESLRTLLAETRQLTAFTNPLTSHKAASARRPALADLKPVRVAELMLDDVHTGRVLRGRLVVDALTINSVMTVLEDDAGDVVNLCLYNCLPAPPPGTTLARAQRLAQAAFPRGAEVAVAEPFYKLLADGTRGVRVDDRADVTLSPLPRGEAGDAPDAGAARSPPMPPPTTRVTKPRRPNRRGGTGFGGKP